MKKALPILLVICMLLFGFVLLFYPDISSWYNARIQHGLIEEMTAAVEGLDPEYVADHFRRAQEYNEALNGGRIQDPFVAGSGAVLPPAYYMETLNVGGVMARIQIPRLNIDLPVFHTTFDDVLERGVGHIEGTSFPIGGQGTHAVLTGHSGLAHARMFTPLLRYRGVGFQQTPQEGGGIQHGDLFFIYVLDQILAYEVDSILIVEPHEVETLRISQEHDYVTLITCTPYAINSHRLLVRGARVPFEPEILEEIVPEVDQELDFRVILIVGFVGLFLFGLLIYKIRDSKRKRRAEIERLRQIEQDWRRK